MDREAPTWFGFTITQKQSIFLFILALIGILFCIFVFTLGSMALIIVLDTYFYGGYYLDEQYLVSSLVGILPVLVFFFVVFLICSYTISKCRKSAKFYNLYNESHKSQIQTTSI